jgi:hypothetical protein
MRVRRCIVRTALQKKKKKSLVVLTTSLSDVRCALAASARMSAELLFLIVQYLRHATPLRDASE